MKVFVDFAIKEPQAQWPTREKITQLDAEIRTVLRELELGPNFPIVLDDDFSPEVRRDHYPRQERAREVLASRRPASVDASTFRVAENCEFRGFSCGQADNLPAR